MINIYPCHGLNYDSICRLQQRLVSWGLGRALHVEISHFAEISSHWFVHQKAFRERVEQIVHLYTNIILLVLQKVFEVTLKLNYRRPSTLNNFCIDKIIMFVPINVFFFSISSGMFIAPRAWNNLFDECHYTRPAEPYELA